MKLLGKYSLEKLKFSFFVSPNFCREFSLCQFLCLLFDFLPYFNLWQLPENWQKMNACKTWELSPYRYWFYLFTFFYFALSMCLKSFILCYPFFVCSFKHYLQLFERLTPFLALFHSNLRSFLINAIMFFSFFFFAVYFHYRIIFSFITLLDFLKGVLKIKLIACAIFPQRRNERKHKIDRSSLPKFAALCGVKCGVDEFCLSFCGNILVFLNLSNFSPARFLS